MWHFHHPFSSFQWRQRAARQLWNMGREEEAKDLLGITEEGFQEMHAKLARRAERRAKRRGTLLGRVMNFFDV